MIYVMFAFICVLIAVGLLAHHHHKHSQINTPDYLPDENEQWFQMSDLESCNLCSHEVYIVLFSILALIFAGLVIGNFDCW